MWIVIFIILILIILFFVGKFATKNAEQNKPKITLGEIDNTIEKAKQSIKQKKNDYELKEFETDIKSLTFTAIDIETANESMDSICSFGYAQVENGIIIKSGEYLIKPKYPRFNVINTRLHGITEYAVKKSLQFNELWNEIKPLIENKIVLAHNMNYDYNAIERTLLGYNINLPYFKAYCSLEYMKLIYPNLKSYKLDNIAANYHIELEHHNAKSDAETCAIIIIKAINKEIIDLNAEPPKKKKTISKPDLNRIEDKSNLFYNKRVVVTGIFNNISREEIKYKLYEVGATNTTGLSKLTDYMIIGQEPGPYKMEQLIKFQHEGINIKVMYEDEMLIKLFNNKK
jgi:DNA polymerase III subunit epsilon